MNVAAMRAAVAEVDELLGQAIEMAAEGVDPADTPQRAETRAGTVRTYIALAGVAVERFEEATRGS